MGSEGWNLFIFMPETIEDLDCVRVGRVEYHSED